MKVEVIAVMNRIPTAAHHFYAQFVASLERFGEKPIILGLNEPWGGLMTKPRKLQKYLQTECKADVIMAVDAWDLVFAKCPCVIAHEWLAAGGKWTIGGERNLFPFGDEEAYPKCTSTYRFPNSGFIISTPQDMLAVLDSMDLPSIPDDHVGPNGAAIHPNDQEEYQKAFLKQPILMEIDSDAKYVWNLYGVDESNFDFSQEIPVNRETGYSPGVFHANGPAKDAGPFSKVLKHLNLI